MPRLPIFIGFSHFAASLVLLRIPGFEVPGYLSALAVGFLLMVTAPIMGYCQPVPDTLRRAFRSVAGGASVLFLGSLTVALVNSFFWPVCNPRLAMGFWVLGPLFGACFGVALGMAIRVHTLRFSPWVGPALLLGLFLASLCWHLHRIYTEPAVAFYHPLVGNFAGPIYERNPQIRLPYIWHRLWWAGSFLLFFSSWVALRDRALWVGAIWLLLGFGLRSPLGIDIGREGILEELSAMEEGEHIRLHASEGWHTPEDLERLAKVLDFHAIEICQWLGVAPPDGKTDVFLFRNRDQKRNMIGAGDTEIAKPWLNEIYVKESDPDAMVLRHELAHALSAVLASGPLGVPLQNKWLPNMPLIEGLATAATWERGPFTPHQWTAMARELELTPSLEELFNPAVFWKNYGPLAYSMSASFVAWLRDNHGPVALQAVYSGQELEKVTSFSIIELETRWQETCLRQSLDSVSSKDRVLADELLSRKPVYQRPCGLEVESLLFDAMNHAREGSLDEALAVINLLVERSGNDPQLQAGRIGAARLAGEPVAMVELSVELLDHPEVQRLPRLEAKTRKQLSDALWWLGAPEAALRAIESVAPHLLSRPDARALWARRFLLARNEPGDALLLNYLTGRPSSAPPMEMLHEQSLVRPADPIVQYLYAFRLQRRGATNLAADAFEKVGLSFNFPPLLTREAAYRAGILRAFQGRLGAADVNIDRALNLETSGGYRLAIERWKRFIAFLRSS